MVCCTVCGGVMVCCVLYCVWWCDGVWCYRLYEERPISRLPNPFRENVVGLGGEGPPMDLPPPAADHEPNLPGLTTSLETVRRAIEALRHDVVGSPSPAPGHGSTTETGTTSGVGSGSSAGPSVATEPRSSVTNLPRRLNDFLRRSRNLAARQHQQQERGGGEGGTRGGGGLPRSGSPWPRVVIPRITLSDPSGSESQVEEELGSTPPGPSLARRDQAEFSTRSVSGVPLRLLGRQYAVDRRSPDSEDSSGPLDGAGDGPGQPSEPFFPWREHLNPFDMGGLSQGPGSEMLFRHNLQRAPPDRAAEREAESFFNRQYFTPHLNSTRGMSSECRGGAGPGLGGNTGYRLNIAHTHTHTHTLLLLLLLLLLCKVKFIYWSLDEKKISISKHQNIFLGRSRSLAKMLSRRLTDLNFLLDVFLHTLLLHLRYSVFILHSVHFSSYYVVALSMSNCFYIPSIPNLFQ